MTTTSHAHQRSEKHKRDDADSIPVNDVPAFGVQFRFAKRTVQDMLAYLKRRNGSSKRT
jgi:hypothetical protein